MRTIGLTGGIATGKSEVAAIMEGLGAKVVDADMLSRDAVAPGMPALLKLTGLFGSGILNNDGSLDRQAVRSMVFSDRKKLCQLESVMHPAIKELALARLDALRTAGTAVSVYMAPLLIEAGATDRVDEVWVVTVRPEIQIKRLVERDGCSMEEAKRIVEAQMPLNEKAKHGIVLIDNSRTLEETRIQVIEAWKSRGLST